MASGDGRLPDLHAAAKAGDARRVKKRLEEGDDVNSLVGGTSPLLFAVANKHNKVVRILLRAGADTSVQDNLGRTAAFWASESGSLDVLKSLIEAKADLNLSADLQLTPLMRASQNKHTKVVRLLLDALADVAAEAKCGSTALIHAITEHQYDIVNMLLDAGAEVNHVNDLGQCSVHFASERGDKVMIDLLLTRGAKADMADCFGFSPLIFASQCGHNDCVSMLLRSGADVSKKLKDGNTALHMSTLSPPRNLPDLSIGSDRVKVVETLLSAGASVHDRNEKGESPLMLSVGEAPHADQVAFVQLLLEAGSDPNLSNNVGETSLMRAGDLSLVKMLLAAKASVDLLNTVGLNVLHYAGMEGRSTAIIMALYQAGADATAINDFGKTPADTARCDGHPETAKLLDLLAAKQRDKGGAGASTAPKRNGSIAGLCKVIPQPYADKNMERFKPKEDDNEIELIERKAGDQEQQPRIEKPCDHCGTVTHKRCSGCTTTFFCSRYCQRVAYKAHKPVCLAAQEERKL